MLLRLSQSEQLRVLRRSWAADVRGPGGVMIRSLGCAQLKPRRRCAAQARSQVAPRDTVIVLVQVVVPLCVAVQHAGRPRRIWLCAQPAPSRAVARRLRRRRASATASLARSRRTRRNSACSEPPTLPLPLLAAL